MKRGDVFYADLRPVIGSEQGGIRPVLIIQNDIGNKHSPTVICAAITSKMNKAKLPTHIELSSALYNMDKDIRNKVLYNMTTERDLRNQMAYARKLAIEEGLAEGRRKANMESALRFKQLGVAVEIISEATGLSVEEIEGL